jgi:type VI secretion system secreted protein Hcp
MAIDCFLKFEEIKGESADSKHGGEIDVLSWSWGASQTGTFQMGGGGGTAKVTVSDLTVTKYVDKATPVLYKFCCKGSNAKVATLTMRKAGGSQLEYLKVTMEDTIISSIKTSSPAGAERVTEDVTLNFARVRLEYTPQKADGSGEAVVKTGYDIAKNIEL